MADDKRIIGRAEIIDIPDWDLYGIKAKIDTGAYTSSLHCHHIERVKENGKEYIALGTPVVQVKHKVKNPERDRKCTEEYLQV